MTRRIVFAVVAASLALAVLGCGGGGPTVVSGTVKYKGTPLTAGSVTIQVAGKRPASGPINPDGTYRVENAPTGEAKILVQTPASAPVSPPTVAVQPIEGASTAKVVSIPQRFADPEKSNLSAVIKSGGQQHHIDIND